MVRVQGVRILLALPVLLAVVASVRAVAQDDPDEVPLGDVARNLRKNNPQTRQIIDDDNLPEVMDQADSHQGFGSSLRFLMAGSSTGFQVSTPDVTCSLSFTANVKSLLSNNQYAQMELPPGEIGKLEGQAAIEGDTLTVPLFNGTQWHVSELAVALTVVKKAETQSATLFNDISANDAASALATLKPAVGRNAIQEVRPEKKPDVTVIYRMRTAAPPRSRAVFSAPLNLDLAPGEEWHWAIVQARGYPPENPPSALEEKSAPSSGEGVN